MSTMLTIKGVYRDGKVELSERPRDVSEETPVMVTFLTNEQSQGQKCTQEPGRSGAAPPCRDGAIPGTAGQGDCVRRPSLSEARATL